VTRGEHRRDTAAGERLERMVAGAASVRPLPAIKANPAIVRGVVVALTLLAALGVSRAANVDPDTIEAIAYVIGVLAPVVATVWTRFAVTPNAKVVTRISPSTGTVVAGEASAFPAGSPVELEPALVDGTRTVAAHVPVDPALLE
jgi:hypothetical protein